VLAGCPFEIGVDHARLDDRHLIVRTDLAQCGHSFKADNEASVDRIGAP